MRPRSKTFIGGSRRTENDQSRVSRDCFGAVSYWVTNKRKEGGREGADARAQAVNQRVLGLGRRSQRGGESGECAHGPAWLLGCGGKLGRVSVPGEEEARGGRGVVGPLGQQAFSSMFFSFLFFLFQKQFSK